MLLCDSALGWSPGGDPAALVRLAADAGFDGLAVARGAVRSEIAGLVVAAAGAGLVVPVATAPLPEARLAPGSRLPYLAAETDDREREAAVAEVARTVAAVASLGVQVLTIECGAVDVSASPRELSYRFARGEWDPDERGGKLWAAALAERRARSLAVLDACRLSLERVLAATERQNMTVAVELSPGPWGAPTPREAEILLAEFRGARFGIVWDESRLAVLRALGIGPDETRAANLLGGARVIRVAEAVGADAPYLPGLGDSAHDNHHGPFPPSIPWIVTGTAPTRPDELSQAREPTTRRIPTPTPAAPDEESAK